MNESGVRKHRIAGAIRKHLSAELAREVADPRLFSLAISDVDLTSDLSLAKIKVRLMFGGEELSARQDAMRALGRIAPGLRSSLAVILRMRRVPEIRFYYDEAADINAEIEGVLRDIEREDEAKKQALAGQGGSRSLDETDPDGE
jgi:ribosome-binding factor A